MFGTKKKKQKTKKNPTKVAIYKKKKPMSDNIIAIN